MSQASPTTAPRRVLCVSIPRSGHHYLVSILRRALGDDECFYCEYYAPVDCCRTVPCTRGGTARLAIQKNHDFDLTAPTSLPGLVYVVQHRNPVMAVLSDREYLARIEGPERADDAHEFRVWLGLKAAHFRGFWDKWLARADSGRVVVDYADLLQHPVAAAQRVLAAAGISIAPGRLEEAVRAVSGAVADFPRGPYDIPFEARVMTRSRYFDPELMSVYESMLLDTIVGLRPTGMLSRVETSKHPIRLVYEAARRSGAGAAGEAAALLREAASADPENPFVHVELSHACWESGDEEGAVAAVAEALRLRPTGTIFSRLLSNDHITRLRMDLDQAIAMRAMAEAPADPAIWRECSEILARAGDLGGALEAVRQALVRRPDQAEFHHHLGNLLARGGDVDDAIQSHRHALDLAPDQAHWRDALVNELLSAGRDKDALRVREDGLRLPTGHGLPDASPERPTREDVLAAYRLLLGREPEDEQVIAGHLMASDRTALVRTFVESPEFRSRVTSVRLPTPTGVVSGLADFAPASWPVPDPDYWVDALGVRHRCAIRTMFSDRGGQVFQEPRDSPLEWHALLEALAAASDRFCMIELGAGYGPWLARAGVAWRRRHPDRELVLVGVEAEPEHFRVLAQHLADNGIPDACVRLLHAAVSEEDGFAEFEVARLPAAEWGTRLVSGTHSTGLPRLANPSRIRVRTMSLNSLASHLGLIDLLHVDIQGSEVAVLRAAGSLLRSQVRRLLVGTHGRDVEAQLIELLIPLGFHLRTEHPCQYRLDGPEPVLVTDGTQVWVNRALVAG